MPRFDLSKLGAFSKLQELLAGPPKTPVIGIDFGTRQLKLLQISGVDNPALLAASACDVPDDLLSDPFKRLDWQMAKLPGLLKAGGFKGKRAAICVPPCMMFCKHLQLSLPEQNAKELVTAVIAESLACDGRALEVRYRVVTTVGGGKSEVLAMAVGRGLIHRMLSGLKGAGLEMVALHPETLATLRSFDTVTRRDGDAEMASLYLDIGASGTRVLIAHGKEPVFIKPIAIGGVTLDMLIREQLKCTLSEARTQRLAFAARTTRQTEANVDDRVVATEPVGRTGIPSLDAAVAASGQAVGAAIDEAGTHKTAMPLAAVLDRRNSNAPNGYSPVREMIDQAPVHEAVEALADEVAMCLRYHTSLFPGKRVERCYFVGGESAVGDMAAYVAKKLRMQAHIADPLARLARTAKHKTPGVDFDVPQPGWAAVVGLCNGPTDL
jgi:Tfp pilus assembly PilM family ATPase